MCAATIAVRGSASAQVPADFAVVHFQHQFTLPARSDALSHGNDIIAQLRDVAAQGSSGVRDMKVRSLRVEEAFSVVGSDHVRAPSGWSTQLTGEAHAESDSVPQVVAALTKVGVSIGHVSWHLEPENEARAQRDVRRQAVGNALEAANDFAAALGGALGNLIALADPGLLGAGASVANSRGPIRTMGGSLAAATSGTSWDERVDLDPSVITVSASVEASYEVSLD
jgi:uncharacterized protein YggE